MKERAGRNTPRPRPDSAGDQASFEALNAGFRASLHRYFARRVRDASEIDDMVQQVFERLLKRGDVSNVEHLGGYVFQTASSVFADHLRRRRTRHADALDEFDERNHGDVDFSPEHVLLEGNGWPARPRYCSSFPNGHG